MENLVYCDQKTLINELTQGRELAKQLQIHLNVPYSSHEFRELLAQKILKSYENVLSTLKSNGSEVGISESPRWFSGSPHSEDSDREYKNPKNGDGSRKRKSLVPGWTQKVQVCPGARIEGPLDDGYSWRKYGQKDILGATYPRGYYRCIHRNLCLATKQVQRSNENPTIFEITYKGSHTCTQNGLQTPPEKQETNTAQENHQTTQQPQPNQQNYSPQILLNFQTGLKVVTKDLDNFEQPFSSIYFPSSMVECNNFMGSFSSSSSSSSFVSPTQMNNTNDLSEIVSAANSSINSPTLGLDFPFGSMEFDPNFTFGNNPRFFS